MLTGIGLASFQGAQAKARDAKRKGDLKALQTALQAYYNDNQKFPNESGFITGTNGLISDLSPSYIKQIPTDPSSGTATPYCYTISTDQQSYSLYALLENTKDSAAKVDSNGNPIAGTCGGQSYNYIVINP